jgi:hypothetical protein
MHKFRFAERLPARGRTRAALVILGLFVSITPVLEGAASAQGSGFNPGPFFAATTAASKTTLRVGHLSTITVNSVHDLPHSIQIYDTTTNKSIASCTGTGPGTGVQACTVQVSQPVSTTHTYQGRLFKNNTVLVAESNTSYVTWTDSGQTISLTTETGFNFITLTALANPPVGGFPGYTMDIFAEDGPHNTASTLVASCAGSSCVAKVTSPRYYVAFVHEHTCAISIGCQTAASSNVVLAEPIPPK